MNTGMLIGYIADDSSNIVTAWYAHRDDAMRASAAIAKRLRTAVFGSPCQVNDTEAATASVTYRLRNNGRGMPKVSR